MYRLPPPCSQSGGRSAAPSSDRPSFGAKGLWRNSRGLGPSCFQQLVSAARRWIGQLRCRTASESSPELTCRALGATKESLGSVPSGPVSQHSNKPQLTVASKLTVPQHTTGFSRGMRTGTLPKAWRSGALAGFQNVQARTVGGLSGGWIKSSRSCRCSLELRLIACSCYGHQRIENMQSDDVCADAATSTRHPRKQSRMDACL